MKSRLGPFVAVLMCLAVMSGFAVQDTRQLSNDRSNEAAVKDRDLNTESMRSSNHDQTPDIKDLVREMQKFLQRFPGSELAPLVRQLLITMEETLAAGDFSVAKFYADRGNYAGARSRWKTIIDNYPDFSRIDEVRKLYETLTPARRLPNAPGEEAK